MSVIVTDPFAEMRDQIERAGQRTDLPAEERLIQLRGIRSDLESLLGLVGRYQGDAHLEQEAREPTMQEAILRLREEALIRETMIESGRFTASELDQFGLLSMDDIDLLNEEKLLEAWVLEEWPHIEFDALKHPRGPGGKWADVLGRVIHPKGRGGKKVPGVGKAKRAERAASGDTRAERQTKKETGRAARAVKGDEQRAKGTAKSVEGDVKETLQQVEQAGKNAAPKPGTEAERVLHGAKDTQELHTVPVRGKGATRWYTPEREQLHNRIIDTLLRQRAPVEGANGDVELHPHPNGEFIKPPDDGKPRALFMAGGTAPLALDTLVATPSGWTTMGKVEVGDLVFGVDGEPTRVVGVSPVFVGRECFEVVFDDGTVVVADAAHKWTTSTRNERRKAHRGLAAHRGTTWSRGAKKWMAQATSGGENHYLGLFSDRDEASATALAFRREHGIERPLQDVRTTAEIRATLRHANHANHSVRNASPLRLPEAELPVDPYTLGAWLGDGTSASGGLTTADEEIVWRIRAGGYEVTKHQRKYGYGIKGLYRQLRLAGLLDNKHIPNSYKRSSERQRRALLAGLMDTDGSATKHGVAEFYSSSQRLAEDVFEIVASLGYRPTIRQKKAMLDGRDCGWTWTVAFTADESPFYLSRKRERHMPQGARQESRYIVDVRPTASTPVRCITVESESHLFLVGRSFVPTHNSGKSTALALPENRATVPEGQAVHIDPDEIKSLIPEYVQMQRAKDSYAAQAVHEESSDIAKRLYDEATKRGLHVVIDGTGDSGEGKFAGKLQTAKDAGYEVHVLYVNAGVDTAIERAVRRAQRTGRWVPEPEIRVQHKNVSARFAEVRKLVEGGHVTGIRMYQTDTPEPVLFADGGNGAFNVHQPDVFQSFVAKADA